jgi:glycosyltransferase involved in cell wall biosynthesis
MVMPRSGDSNMGTKILIDARMLSGPVHGIARYAYSVATGVARLRPDWTIGVWTHRPQVWESNELPNLVPVYVKGTPFSLREQWDLPRSAREFGADLVHFCSIAVPYLLPRRSVVTVHDLTPLHFPRSKIHSTYLKIITGSILRRTPMIICGSDFTSADVQKHLKIPQSKINVISYGGLDDKISVSTSISMSPPSLRPYFLCVSNPKPHKNLRMLFEAFRPLESDFDLMLVSPWATWMDPELAGRKAIRRQHGLSDDALMELYKGALAVVIPSLYEGFGIPVLEAMQLGVPVVSSSATSLPEVVGEAGLLFDPQDAEGLTSQLWKVALEPELRAEMVRQGKHQATKFSWAKCAEAHVAAFEKLLKTG